MKGGKITPPPTQTQTMCDLCCHLCLFFHFLFFFRGERRYLTLFDSRLVILFHHHLTHFFFLLFTFLFFSFCLGNSFSLFLFLLPTVPASFLHLISWEGIVLDWSNQQFHTWLVLGWSLSNNIIRSLFRNNYNSSQPETFNIEQSILFNQSELKMKNKCIYIPLKWAGTLKGDLTDRSAIYQVNKSMK